MYEQPSIPGTAVEAIHIHMVWHQGQGWSVRVGARRQFETWEDAREDLLERLTSPEAADAVDGTLAAILGL